MSGSLHSRSFLSVSIRPLASSYTQLPARDLELCRLAACKSISHGDKTYVRDRLSWAHALFIVAAALNLLSVPAVDSVLLHCLLNGYGWGALYETTADFQTGGGTPPAGSAGTAQGTDQGCLIGGCEGLITVPYSPTAVGTALGAVAGSMASAQTALDLSDTTAIFPLNPKLTGGVRPNSLPGNITYPSLLAWGFRGGMGGATDSSNITVVNLSARPLSALLAQESNSFTTWSSPSREGPVSWATARAPVRVQTGTTKGHLVLQPYSITVINIAYRVE